MTAAWCGLAEDDDDSVQCGCCLAWFDEHDIVELDELDGTQLCPQCWRDERAEHPERYAWMDSEEVSMSETADITAAFAELRRVCQSGHLEDTGGLLAVARHVLANADRWRGLLGMAADGSAAVYAVTGPYTGPRFVDPPAAYQRPRRSLEQRLERLRGEGEE